MSVHHDSEVAPPRDTQTAFDGILGEDTGKRLQPKTNSSAIPTTVLHSSLTATMTPLVDEIYFFDNPDLVDWLGLLHKLHLWTYHVMPMDEDLSQQPSGGSSATGPKAVIEWEDKLDGPHFALPAVSPRISSWDLVPLDVVKPQATTTIGDIVVLTHRMRMRWVDLRPNDGRLRAEGESGSLTNVSRGLGVVLAFSSTRPGGPSRIASFIPSREADMFGCGILPQNPVFSFAEHPVYPTDDSFRGISRLLEDIGVTREARLYVCSRESLDEYHARRQIMRCDSLPGVADIVPMMMPFMPLQGSRIAKLISPFPTELECPLWRVRYGRFILHGRLRQLVRKDMNPHPQLSLLLGWLDMLQKDWSSFYNNIDDFGGNMATLRHMQFSSFLRTMHDGTTKYLTDLCKMAEEKVGRPFKYSDLVAAHVTVVALDAKEFRKKPDKEKKWRTGADAGIPNMQPRPRFNLLQRAHRYADLAPKIAQHVLEQGSAQSMTEIDLVAAYWTMLVRAMAWDMSVFILIPEADRAFPVPSDYYYSRIPVSLT